MTHADLIGERFGRLRIVRKLDERNANGRVCWEAVCDCGNLTVSNTQNYRNGQKQSCGCLYKETRKGAVKNLKDLTGMRFGRYRVIRRAGNVSGSRNARWKCKCDCGVTRIVAGGHLIKGASRSCGCYMRERNTKHGQSQTPRYTTYITTRRAAAKLQRTPKWANQDAIKEFYQNCPAGHHVDHIIPLQAERASGLHVIENLQYLSVAENTSKQNRFEPYTEIR
jgi:hypothetical protein